ncbi:HAD family hydrolase [Rothia nasimurium]|uniref:HAD family hydrolase n=1 Tax=Rothia nasimurium TaxID=85336 RepID=UPI001F266F5C|nr:HAD family hydrolase [Rothia nasimurium]
MRDTGHLLAQANLVLFDLDGTLLDNDTATAVGFNRAVRDFGFEGEIEDTQSYFQAWADIQREDFQRYLAGEQVFDENRLFRTSSLLHLMTGEQQRADRAQKFLMTLQDETRKAWSPFAEVDRFFEELGQRYGHLQVAVISNGSQLTEQKKLDAIGLHDMPLFSSERVGISKPDPLIFRFVCAQLEVNPAYAVHVGDNYIADVAAPARAGLQAAWVNRHRRGQKLPRGTVKVRDLVELLDAPAPIARRFF